MKFSKGFRSAGIRMSIAVCVGSLSFSGIAVGADAVKDQAALVKALGQSKLSLADSLRQATKSAEIPISAKFEFDDKGKLSLSVYTVEKGLAVDAEGNVLKELSGSPELAKWTPDVEVFKDIPHVSRASQRLALMAISPFSLADMVVKTQQQHPGTVYSIKPAVRNHQPVFIALVADKGRTAEVVLGLLDGNLKEGKK